VRKVTATKHFYEKVKRADISINHKVLRVYQYTADTLTFNY